MNLYLYTYINLYLYEILAVLSFIRGLRARRTVLIVTIACFVTTAGGGTPHQHDFGAGSARIREHC